MKQLGYWIGLTSGIIYCLAIASPVLSQSITRDGTLSTSITSPDNLNFTITQGNRAGGNLFHSFSQFSVPAGGSAFFDNAPDIKNIISRVTGGSVSNIDGLLRANGAANLFLLNSNGIIFGPKAQLNLGGSFLASTANSLKFADGTQFSATAPQTPLLTVSVPIGLQFGGTAGSILNQSQATDQSGRPVGLQVRPGKTLALVGGDVTLKGGGLIAPGGRIELGSVAGPSFISLSSTDASWALGYEGVQNFQDIQLSQQSSVTASGSPSSNIQIQGRRVTLIDGSRISLNANRSSGSAATLTVNASQLVEVIGSSADGKTNTSLLSTIRGSEEDAGDLNIKTGRLIIRDGGVVSSSTFGGGASGELTVSASQSVEVIGTSANSRSPSILTTGTFSSGNAGSLTIATGKLIVRDGGLIVASTYADGAAGNVTVTALESVELSGTSADGRIPSSIRSDAVLYASPAFREQFNLPDVVSGNARNLTITTGQLIVRDGAEVAVSNEGLGNGGELEVMANSVQLDNGNISASTESGVGGNIKRLQVQNLQLRRGSQISTTAGGSGNGGDITIDTDTLVALENSDITANAFEGQGGNIQIQTQGIFRSMDSDITASSNLGISGVVEVKTLDTDPSGGVVNLPQEVINVEELVAQECSANGGQASSEFVVTGRGGLPPNPSETLGSDTVLINLGTRVPQGENRSNPAISTNPTSIAPVPIVEAQGWVRTANGQIILTAQPPNVTPDNPRLTPATCHAS